MGSSKHGKAACIQASKAFKQRGSATGHTKVMSKCSTLPGSEKKSQTVLEVCSSKGLWPCNSWI